MLQQKDQLVLCLLICVKKKKKESLSCGSQTSHHLFIVTKLLLHPPIDINKHPPFSDIQTWLTTQTCGR